MWREKPLCICMYANNFTVMCCFVEILTLKEVFQIASNGKCTTVNVADIAIQWHYCRTVIQKISEDGWEAESNYAVICFQ